MEDIKKYIEELGISKKQLFNILKGKTQPPVVLKKSIKSKIFKVGLVGDTHLASSKEKRLELHSFYAQCKKEGVKEIYHAGDVVAGWGMFFGQENEVKVYGADNQVEYVVEHYPKETGIKTYFITGNHDLCWWNKSGIDIGEKIAAKRSDMVYLGQYQADIEINGVTTRLLHPDGGNPYALSYRSQKIAESISSGDKPHILALGHLHTSIYYVYRNIHIIQVGCFEGQSNFLMRKGINPVIGGWILEIETIDDPKNTVLSLSPRFVAFPQ